MNHAIVTLDETGSMSGQEHRIVTSLNEYVKYVADRIMLRTGSNILRTNRFVRGLAT